MPIQIKELVIKVTVQDDGAPAALSGGGQAAEQDKEDMIEECVEKVLEILHEKYKGR